METKDQLIQSIKDWVKIDNEMRTLQSEITKRKKEKKTISEKLISVMRDNEIDVFDINDGQIMYMKKTVKSPITKAALLTILADYFKGDVQQAMEINNFIMENREETVKETIVRKLKSRDK